MELGIRPIGGSKVLGGPGRQRHDGKGGVGTSLCRQNTAVSDEEIWDGERAQILVDHPRSLVGGHQTTR